jgi:hypothetical protein
VVNVASVGGRVFSTPSIVGGDCSVVLQCVVPVRCLLMVVTVPMAASSIGMAGVRSLQNVPRRRYVRSVLLTRLSTLPVGGGERVGIHSADTNRPGGIPIRAMVPGIR